MIEEPWSLAKKIDVDEFDAALRGAQPLRFVKDCPNLAAHAVSE